MQALKEDSLLVVSSKKSFLDKCRLPVGIKLLVSAGHSDSDLVKVAESLKRLASELLLLSPETPKLIQREKEEMFFLQEHQRNSFNTCI